MNGQVCSASTDRATNYKAAPPIDRSARRMTLVCMLICLVEDLFDMFRLKTILPPVAVTCASWAWLTAADRSSAKWSLESLEICEQPGR